jgi:predicted amino acid-binding ACT domain protein
MSTLADSRVLLIDITGPDRAGVTHSLTSILAASGARIPVTLSVVLQPVDSRAFAVELPVYLAALGWRQASTVGGTI